jgi:hypothetical protein
LGSAKDNFSYPKMQFSDAAGKARHKEEIKKEKY